MNRFFDRVLTLILWTLVLGVIYPGTSYSQDDDFPPVLEDHEFKKYRIYDLTSEELSNMALDHPRLKLAYFYYFVVLPRHGVKMPEWQKNVRSDMQARAGDAQPLFESMYRSKRSLDLQKRMLKQMKFFPSIDKTRFIPIICQELDLLPEKMTVREVIDSQMCSKMEFILRWGGAKQIKYVRGKVEQYDISDPLTLKALKEAEMMMAKRNGGTKGDTPALVNRSDSTSQASGADQDSGESSQSIILYVILIGGTIMVVWYMSRIVRVK